MRNRYSLSLQLRPWRAFMYRRDLVFTFGMNLLSMLGPDQQLIHFFYRFAYLYIKSPFLNILNCDLFILLLNVVLHQFQFFNNCSK